VRKSYGHDLTPTGTTVKGSPDGWFDEDSYQICFVRVHALEKLIATLDYIAFIHRPYHEDFVSRCQHDGEPYPCTTMRAAI